MNLLWYIDNCVGPCARTRWLKWQVCSNFLSFWHIVWYFGQDMSQMVTFLEKKRQICNRRKISHLVTLKICGMKISQKTGFWGLIISGTIFLGAHCLYNTESRKVLCRVACLRYGRCSLDARSWWPPRTRRRRRQLPDGLDPALSSFFFRKTAKAWRTHHAK